MWKNGKPKLKVEASKLTLPFHLVHLRRNLPLCAFFQMFTRLSGRMILVRLQGRIQSSRKHLQQQAEAVQDVSIQTMSLQGLAQHQCSLHHHPGPVQNPWMRKPQGYLSIHRAATPMTPGNPPRPPIEALPKPMPQGTSQATQKHPLPEPAQQGPSNKQVRHKAFPYALSMTSPSAVDTPRIERTMPERSSSILHANSR